MKVYFVRHGSTDLFEKKFCQTDDEPLNKKGQKQARELGQRFQNIPLDLIVSSSHTRALQTAQAISPHVEVSSLFVEIRKPSEIIGKSKENENTKNILKKIDEMYLADPSWHYSDEENFEDLKKRGIQALDFLISQNKENILVVSHANFISLMAGLMMFGENFPVDLSLRLKNFFRLGNTGVSICTYDPEKNHWQLQCWNDTSHLLE
jgi:broad specificity phosphatase PhoE